MNDEVRAWLDGLQPGDVATIWDSDGPRSIHVVEVVNKKTVRLNASHSEYSRVTGQESYILGNRAYIRPVTPAATRMIAVARLSRAISDLQRLKTEVTHFSQSVESLKRMVEDLNIVHLLTRFDERLAAEMARIAGLVQEVEGTLS